MRHLNESQPYHYQVCRVGEVMFEDLNERASKDTIPTQLLGIAERRAQKIDTLLNGQDYCGDYFNGLQISKSKYESGGANFLPHANGCDTKDVFVYSLKVVVGGDTLLNYQLYNPPLGIRMEDMLYAEARWQNGKFAGMTGQTMGEYFEKLVDEKQR